ncbi:MAG: 50S ribosomal protein L15 [Bacteroidales bacterium]|nr:50S ribosomal protein L15 [Bacteroidales bacterium]MCI5482353.1 50S ribosomal protein L15 [Bacteroidales bacterium]MDD6750861.1 50S ribosomal protein L15 [Bacteroidales bacterium]MDY2877686.1 50S ribosomal protein L15 [Candidatus Cryptobacteroides sp.]
MKLNNLTPAAGSTHTSKRLGRGQGSGKGGTSTRGTKGAQARAGYEHKIGFEGGQMPIQRRLPKFGFKNPTRVEYLAVNVSTIEALAARLGVNEIGVQDIRSAGFASKTDLVKVLGNGEIKTAVTVTADAFSKSAIAKIEAAGGKAVVTE